MTSLLFLLYHIPILLVELERNRIISCYIDPLGEDLHALYVHCLMLNPYMYLFAQ